MTNTAKVELLQWSSDVTRDAGTDDCRSDGDGDGGNAATATATGRRRRPSVSGPWTRSPPASKRRGQYGNGSSQYWGYDMVLGAGAGAGCWVLGCHFTVHCID
jgi:hypothetical protein